MIELTPEPNGSPRLRAELVTPDGDGPWPGVLLIHEAWGLDDEMRKHARRLAGMGYLTLAVDLYTVGGARRCLVATMRAMLTGRGRAFADIEAGRKWLVHNPDCTGRVGVVGFCMGGGFALLSVHGVDAVSANYGFLPKNLDLTGSCPVVASYGAKDSPLRGAAEKLDAALEKADVPRDVKEYPNAGHAFLNEEANGPKWLRPLLRATHSGPEPESARDGWRRIEDFFGTYLHAER